MQQVWQNIFIEIGLFTLLGVLYYLYQKRKITTYEENKIPMIMDFILQSCLAIKDQQISQELDQVIISLDDFLQQRSPHPPIKLLSEFAKNSACPPELQKIIVEGLKEIEDVDGKK